MDRRAMVGALICLPAVAVVTAFVLAQTQLIRLVGTASWSTALWPSLEWLLGAALVAAWYHADWPRWQWRALGRGTLEALGIAALVVLALRGFVPAAPVPVFDPAALLPTMVAALPLALWCAAEEAVLRGALGRITAPQHIAVRVAILLAGAVVVSLVTGQLAQWHGLVAVAAVESVSVIGAIAGQPLVLLAVRRWWLRMAVVVTGIAAVGFDTGIPPVARFALPDVVLGVLAVVSACVLWGCVVLVASVTIDADDATNGIALRHTSQENGGE